LFSSQPFADIGIADRNREKAEAYCQHQDIQHGGAPVALGAGATYLRVGGSRWINLAANPAADLTNFPWCEVPPRA
jgi:hypothetical protein